MAKPSRGGRRATTAQTWRTTPAATIIQRQAANMGNQPPQPQIDDDQTEDENTLSATSSGEENADFNTFRRMTDDEKADVIAEALREAPPSFLPDNASQRLLAYLGGDNHPTVVSDQQLDAVSGRDIYRQVAGIHDKTLGTNLTSQQIANQVMTGDLTQYAQDYGQRGTGGGTAFGRAIYFGASYSEIRMCYGTSLNVRGKQDSTLFRCKINPKSRGMTYSALKNAVAKEMSSGSKLGRVIRGIGNSDDRETVYALAKGIDWTHDGSYDYHMVYNRGCLLASSRLKHNANDNRW